MGVLNEKRCKEPMGEPPNIYFAKQLKEPMGEPPNIYFAKQLKEPMGASFIFI